MDRLDDELQRLRRELTEEIDTMRDHANDETKATRERLARLEALVLLVTPLITAAASWLIGALTHAHS